MFINKAFSIFDPGSRRNYWPTRVVAAAAVLLIFYIQTPTSFAFKVKTSRTLAGTNSSI